MHSGVTFNYLIPRGDYVQPMPGALHSGDQCILGALSILSLLQALQGSCAREL